MLLAGGVYNHLEKNRPEGSVRIFYHWLTMSNISVTYSSLMYSLMYIYKLTHYFILYIYSTKFYKI